MDGTPLFPSPSVQPLMPVGHDERLLGVVDVFEDFFSEARLYDACRVLSIVNVSLQDIQINDKPGPRLALPRPALPVMTRTYARYTV